MTETSLDKKKAIVSYLLENHFLVTSDILAMMRDEARVDQLYELSTRKEPIQELKKLLISDEIAPLEVMKQYNEPGRKAVVVNFVSMIKARYRAISAILMQRQDLQGVTAIARIPKERQRISLIGLVFDKQETKNGNVIITLEDHTGQMRVMFSKSNEENLRLAKDIMLDEVIGVTGQSGDNIVFGSDILIPEIPLTHELKKGPEDWSMVVLSDIHIGSDCFLKDEFERCIKWMRGELGTPEQRALADKVRYLFIVGDLVDGVGIYPSQEKELLITDIRDQYEALAGYLKTLPARIRIVIIPGNHDAVRIAEPQPPISKDYLGSIYDLPNATILSNPAMVRIAQSGDFEGFDVLLYHGYGFDDYGDGVPSIRDSGKSISERVGFIMKYLLQRRHLAPTIGSTQVLVTSDKDSLVIDSVPDFFLAGHIHRSMQLMHRNVSIISGSCFQAQTNFQEKVGHIPEPAKVPVVNLRTRDITVLDFGVAQ